MNIKPIFDNIVIQAKETKEVTASGFILPGQTTEALKEGVVVSAGEGGNIYGKQVQMLVSAGNTVLYPQNAGMKIKFEGKDYIIMHQTDILAVIE